MSASANPDIVDDGLVFLYDTDDVKSYKGEPTTNFVTNPDFSTGDLTGWSSTSTSNSDVDIAGVFSENGYNYFHKKVNKTANGGQDRLVESSTYNIDTSKRTTISIDIWINPENDYSITFYARGTTADDTTFDEKPLQNNGSTTSTVDLGGGWVRYIYTLQTAWYTGSGTSFRIAIYPAYGGRGLMEYKVRQVQVEQKPHATPFVNGTRSATQGLIDRTGNSTIDLSNASFDSNAQITFNNTTGGMTGVPVAHSYLSSSAIEVVVNPNTLNDKDMVGGYRHNNGYSNPTIGSIYIQYNRFYASVITAAEVYRHVSSNTISANQYYHVVLNKDTVDGQLELFVNGVSQGTVSFDAATYGQWTTAGNYIGTNTLDIGVSTNTNSSQGWGSSTLDGQIPIFKVYNRTLTTAEVRQNYNATKSRFQL